MTKSKQNIISIFLIAMILTILLPKLQGIVESTSIVSYVIFASCFGLLYINFLDREHFKSVAKFKTQLVGDMSVVPSVLCKLSVLFTTNDSEKIQSLANTKDISSIVCAFVLKFCDKSDIKEIEAYLRNENYKKERLRAAQYLNFKILNTITLISLGAAFVYSSNNAFLILLSACIVMVNLYSNLSFEKHFDIYTSYSVLFEDVYSDIFKKESSKHVLFKSNDIISSNRVSNSVIRNICGRFSVAKAKLENIV